MAYDEKLAERARAAIGQAPGVIEKRMFGGLAYLVNGNMACGVNRDNLIVRVGAERYVEALSRPHTRPFDMTGKPMAGWVTIAPSGVAKDSDLVGWLRQGIDFASRLPPK